MPSDLILSDVIPVYLGESTELAARYAADAAASASAVETFTDQAQTYAGQAEGYRDQAEGYRDEAQAARDEASNYAEVASTSGFTVITPVRAATTGNISLSGAQTIDGVSVIATNRVLVKNQTAPAENGIWVAAAGAWSRATDFDQTAEVVQGSYVTVDEGTTQANSAWVLTTADPITVGTTAQSWVVYRELLGYVTETGAQTLSNKTFDGDVDYLTDGGRLSITDGDTPVNPEAIVQIMNAGPTGADGTGGVGLLVTSKWTGQTGDAYTNNDNSLFTTYNKILSDSANRSWGASINNAYNDIPFGVTDSGERVGVIGWATSVEFPGYSHAGTLESQRGVFGTAGFQSTTTPSTAVINAAAGVAALIYAEAPGATIHFAQAGLFASDGKVGGSTIEENYAVYARAQRGTVSNYSFYGEMGVLYNAHNIVCDSQILANTTFTESSSAITARNAGGNSLEFGYAAAGFGSNLCATPSSGYPALAFCAEAEASGNTFRTRGKLGTVIWNNLAGAMIFSRLTNSNATGQSLTESFRIDADGRLYFVNGTYDGPHLRMGASYFWVNAAGQLRTKTSAPASANDGRGFALLEVGADVGNAAKTLTHVTDAPTQVWNTPLTADRAVTLSTTGAVNGARFRIVRTAAATGAFNLNVGTGPLKALAAGQWCDVAYNGSAWMLTAAGSL